MTNWPKDTQSARNAFYGDPGKGEIPRQMVPVIPPFRMIYIDDKGKKSVVKKIQFHRLAANSLLAALNEIWDYCGRDQKVLESYGLHIYGGAYNHRYVRGSNSKWSNHAYATAIDFNPAANGLYAKGNIPQFAIDAFLRQGWMWGGYYSGRKDPMHFEAVDNGGRKPKSPPPAAKRVALTAVGPTPPADAPEDEFGSAKPIYKSKIVQAATAIGVTEGGDALSQVNDAATKAAELKGHADDLGLWDVVQHLVTNPRFIMAAVVVVAVIAIVVWRWKDHE